MALEPVSRRTYAAIEQLTRDTEVAGVRLSYCPCRVLPETVLQLKTLLREVDRLWADTLGSEALETLKATADGGRFFAGQVRLTLVQEGRPEMVGVWLALPPDYPRRFPVQLIDHVEPFELP